MVRSHKGGPEFALKCSRVSLVASAATVGTVLRRFQHLSHLGKVSTALNEGLSGLPQSQAGNLRDHAHLQEWEKVLEWLVLSLFSGDQKSGRRLLMSRRDGRGGHPALSWALDFLQVHYRVAFGCSTQATVWYSNPAKLREGKIPRTPGHNIWALSFCSCSLELMRVPNCTDLN